MTGIVRNKTLAICLALAGAALGAAACSQHDESPSQGSGRPDGKAGNVFIKVSQPEGTRTFIDGEALDRTVWSELDVIGLYWRERGSSAALSGESFSLFRQYDKEAIFSADVAGVAAGDYTYYGAFPLPASVSGTTVTYDLPAIQDGTYDMADYDIRDESTHAAYKGNLDFLIAEPVDAGSITEGEEVALNFVRQCHVLRIQVPTGRNRLGEDIDKLRIEFPSNVVGTMTMDLADPHAAPSLSAGSSVVTADLRKTISESAAGETDPAKYVWVFVCPGDVNGTVTFTGFDVNGYQSKKISVEMNKTLAAGRITPIDLTIPEETPISWIDFSIGSWSNLGEEPNAFTVTAPAGVTFRNGRNEWTFEKNEENLYRVEFYYEYGGVSFGDKINSQGLDIVYDTDNALAPDHIAVAVTDGEGVAKSLTLPYLLFEDFSKVGAMSYTDSSSDVSGRAISGLQGWTGARAAAQAGTRIRSASTRQWLVLVTNNYHGRIDSPQFSALKNDSKVTVRLDFDGGLSHSNARYAFGYTVGNDSPIAGDQGLAYTLQGATNSGIATNGSYTSALTAKSFNIPECTNEHRASWRVTNGASGMTSGTWYLYLDNVRATIVP